MRDPELIDEGEKRIPDEWRRNYLRRPIEKLPADVARSFDRIWAIEREKDLLAARLLKTQKRLASAKRLIYVMSLIVSPIVGELAKLLLSRLIH